MIIYINAAIPDSCERDASGLPEWIETEHGSLCHDWESMVFAFFCMPDDFDLPTFDRWLSQMTDAEAKLELLDHRRKAIAASRNNDHDTVKLHLECMDARCEISRRTNFMLPLARTGQAITRGGKKGGDASRETRRGAGSKRADILVASSAYSGSESAKIATIARKTGATPRYIRSVLKKPEP